MARQFVDLATVAELLAIGIGSAYDLVRSGDLAAIQIGGRGQWRVELSALDDFVERRYSQTRSTRQDRPGH